MDRSTYLSCAKKFTKLGHLTRANNMLVYANKNLTKILITTGKEVILDDVNIKIIISAEYSENLFKTRKFLGRTTYIKFIVPGRSDTGFFYSNVDYGKDTKYSRTIAPKCDNPIIPGMYFSEFCGDRRSAKLIYDLIIKEAQIQRETYIKEHTRGKDLISDQRLDVIDDLIDNINVNNFYKY